MSTPLSNAEITNKVNEIDKKLTSYKKEIDNNSFDIKDIKRTLYGSEELKEDGIKQNLTKNNIKTDEIDKKITEMLIIFKTSITYVKWTCIVVSFLTTTGLISYVAKSIFGG